MDSPLPLIFELKPARSLDFPAIEWLMQTTDPLDRTFVFRKAVCVIPSWVTEKNIRRSQFPATLARFFASAIGSATQIHAPDKASPRWIEAYKERQRRSEEFSKAKEIKIKKPSESTIQAILGG